MVVVDELNDGWPFHSTGLQSPNTIANRIAIAAASWSGTEHQPKKHFKETNRDLVGLLAWLCFELLAGWP